MKISEKSKLLYNIFVHVFSQLKKPLSLSNIEDIMPKPNIFCHRVVVTETGSNKVENHKFVIEKSFEEMDVKEML